VSKLLAARIFYYAGKPHKSFHFLRRLSQDGYSAQENNNTAAPESPGIPCASTPSMKNAAKKILIVDEDDDCRKTLGGFIKGLGHEVFEATTGPEAIDRASSIHPDLIMMDLRLPGMNGDEATARLKRNISTRHIPVVINTAWTTACNVGDRAARALEAGAEEILYKPFQLPMLRNVLRTYLLA
jgi:CheY-like chemotaxis protein